MYFLINCILSVVIPVVMGTIGNLNDRWCRRMARHFTWILRVIYPQGMRLIMDNLRIVYPDKDEKELKHLAKKNLFYSVWNGLDLIRLLKHPELGEGMISERDNGDVPLPPQVIACISHLGNWELEALQVAKYFPHMALVASNVEHFPALNKLLLKSRQSGGGRVIYRNGAATGALQALKNGQSVAMVMDQNLATRHGGIFVNFYSLPIPITPLPALLVKHTQLPVCTATCVRKDDGTYKFIFRMVPLTGDLSDRVNVMQQIMKANEELIRQYPEQYTWLYQRWNAFPGNTPEEMRLWYPKFPRYAQKKFGWAQSKPKNKK